jgi:hypothetical protein
MTYRRRQTSDASLADWRSQTERLAAVRSIRFVRESKLHHLNNLRQQSPVSQQPSVLALRMEIDHG